MKMVDPDVESDDQVLLQLVPNMDGDGYYTEWREMEFDDMMMEKFVLVPDMSPIGSMTGATEPTFLLALSEVRSLVVLAGGRCCGKRPSSDGVRYSVCSASCRKRISGGLCWE